jgi:type VI secretion system secreted protein Hcp
MRVPISRSLLSAGLLLGILLISSTTWADEICVQVKLNQMMLPGEAPQGSTCFGAMKVWKFAYDVTVARDTAAGMATGRRQHQPLRITREPGPNSILLWKGLTKNEVAEVTVDFWTTPQAGPKKRYQTLKIMNGRVVEFHRFTEQPDATGNVRSLEEVAFIYHTIEINHYDPNAQHADSVAGAR